jgi:hypothetical protein
MQNKCSLMCGPCNPFIVVRANEREKDFEGDEK